MVRRGGGWLKMGLFDWHRCVVTNGLLVGIVGTESHRLMKSGKWLNRIASVLS